MHISSCSLSLSLYPLLLLCFFTMFLILWLISWIFLFFFFQPIMRGHSLVPFIFLRTYFFFFLHLLTFHLYLLAFLHSFIPIPIYYSRFHIISMWLSLRQRITLILTNFHPMYSSGSVQCNNVRQIMVKEKKEKLSCDIFSPVFCCYISKEYKHSETYSIFSHFFIVFSSFTT